MDNSHHLVNLKLVYDNLNISLYDNPQLTLPSCINHKEEGGGDENKEKYNDDGVWICLDCFEFNCNSTNDKHAYNHYLKTNHSLSIYFDYQSSYDEDVKIICWRCDQLIDNLIDSSNFNYTTKQLLDQINATKLFLKYDKRIDWFNDDELIIKMEPKQLKETGLNGIARYIKSEDCKNIIVLCGAGISVAAGIPDFRSPKSGLYNNIKQFNLPYHEAIFDIDYFKVHPEPFYTISKDIFPDQHKYKPTRVHQFIKLLSDRGQLLRNYTQNIDTLERCAGVPLDQLIEAHGAFINSFCLKCNHQYSNDYIKNIINNNNNDSINQIQQIVPRCNQLNCNGLIKPDVVFFGDALPSRFNECLLSDFNDNKCDLLIVIGTSLAVLPIAQMIDFCHLKCPRLLINLQDVGANNHGGFEWSNDLMDVKWLGDCQQGVEELINLLK